MVPSSFRGVTDSDVFHRGEMMRLLACAHDINALVGHCVCPRPLWAASQRHWGESGRDSARVPSRVRPLNQARAGGRSLVRPRPTSKHCHCPMWSPSSGRAREGDPRKPGRLKLSHARYAHLHTTQDRSGRGARQTRMADVSHITPRCARSTLHGEREI